MKYELELNQLHFYFKKADFFVFAIFWFALRSPKTISDAAIKGSKINY